MRAWRVVIGILLAFAAVAGFGPNAAGVEGLPIICTAAGTVGYVDGSPVDGWTVSGQGSCQGDLEGTYSMSFAGSGTSTGLGVCDASLVVRDLDLLVTYTLVSFATGDVQTIAHRWIAPVTTYPVGTPFIVEHVPAEVPVGAGVFFNHIFLNCSGSPVATFDWAWQT
jgi:hypothetical protein